MCVNHRNKTELKTETITAPYVRYYLCKNKDTANRYLKENMSPEIIKIYT